MHFAFQQNSVKFWKYRKFRITTGSTSSLGVCSAILMVQSASGRNVLQEFRAMRNKHMHKERRKERKKETL